MLKLYHEATDAFGAYPLGNGRLGAMVFGGVGAERVILNEDTLWSGHPVDRTNPQAFPRLEEVRRLLFAGENYKAQQLIEKYMLGELSESYMPMGDLHLNTMLEAGVTDYCHALSMEQSVATVTYRRGYGPASMGFTRRAYVSMPDDVFVMEWEAEKEGTLVFEMSLSSQLNATATAEGNTVRLLGQCPDHVVPNYHLAHPNPVVYDEGKGLRFCIEARVYTDGTVTARGDKVLVSGATRCTILCNSQNTFKHPDYITDCGAVLDAAAARMGDLYARHVADFSEMYNRTTLRLGDSNGEYDMEALIEAARRGEQVLPLYEMLFAYGRYLSMTSSRQGLPANLQGIWNWDVRPAWSGNYTTNINLPMNYWHVESCGLPECGEQLALWLETVIPEGEKVAKDYFGCDGWCMNHNVDMWGKMTPTQLEARFGLWPLAGVWLCQHIYNHYRYTNDTAYLRDHALPIMAGAVRFCLDWMVEDEKGQLVTCPSTSPENTFYTVVNGKKEVTSVAISSASDICMIAELLDNYAAVCEVLGVDDDLLCKAKAARARMRWFTLDDMGMLLEYDKAYEETDPGHRHLSHVYGVYPGDLYMDDPVLLEGAKKAYDWRLANGGGRLGWSRAWAIALAARFGRPEQTAELLQYFILASIKYNGFDFYVSDDELPDTRTAHEKPLHEKAFGFFQIDGNFGISAAIVELLMQCYCDRIHLLPCLPVNWLSGEVKGLRAPGDLAVDVVWADGKATAVRLTTGARFDSGKAVNLVLNGVEKACSLEANATYEIAFEQADWNIVLFSEK